jgi:tetratricopeptide (TPR) repeat protein
MSEKNAEFYLNQGNKHRKNSRISNAVQSYVKAIQLDPSFDKPYKRLKSIQKLNEKQRNIIADCYTQVIKKQSELPICAYVQLGDILTKRGNFQEAIKYYQQSTEVLTRTTRPEFYDKYWNSNKGSKPNFIIIGAAKAGTTSLFQYLIQHPQVLSPIKKEVAFFHNNQRYSAGVNWYFSHFPSIPEESGFVTGEATPNYLVSNIQFEVAKLLPEVKLVAILRDPVERAISHYHHRVKHRWENRSLEEAITAELVAVKDEESFSSSIEQACHQAGSVYLLGGLYYYTIKKWMSVFPPEQFLILENTQLLTQPNDTMQKVYSFLGLPEYNISEYKKRNVGSYQKEDISLIENKLYQLFQSHNEKLESFLNINFNWKKI